MRSKTIGLLLITTLIITGCGTKKVVPDYEKIMKGYADTYYVKYVKGMQIPSPNKFEISIANLENANEKVLAGFDLSDLSVCTKESKIILILDTTGEISSYEYQLDCK